jgi:MoaA/NifB/PqqE/SkfB family radical SAM enzyme
MVKENKKLEVFWLRLSYVCNNNCIFCLDYENQIDPPVKAMPLDEIKKEIKKVKNTADKKIVLSGGDPTLHPDLAQIIKYAKKEGFAKVQVITNGRMFVYQKFIKELIEAGLDEVTISFHSHIPEIYEKLTGIKDSFGQAKQGLDNLLNARQVAGNKLIINIDIVINKINLPHLKQTIMFFADMGIYEFDLLFIIPFGRAMINKNDLFFDYQENQENIREILDLAKDNRFYIWLNRFPVQFLEGYEELIQDPDKLFDEIRGRQDMLKFAYENKSEKLPCYSKFRCSHCYISSFCDNFLNQFKQSNENKYKELSIFEFMEKPEFYLDKFGQKELCLFLPKFNSSSNDLEKIRTIKLPAKWIVKDMPFCLIRPNNNKVIYSDFRNMKMSKLDLDKLVRFYIDQMYFIKPLKCEKCIAYKKCKGMNINYLKKHGFKILKPVKK